jgi:HEPN domain-containing protein
MPEADALLSVDRQWIQKAENDLKNATYTLQMGEDCPTDTVCFHAQQCVEKTVMIWTARMCGRLAHRENILQHSTRLYILLT